VCLDVVRDIDKPASLVAANNESTEELAEACRDWPQAHVLHGSGATIDGVEFFGLGGGVPVTPFGAWSYDFTEEQATELLSGCPKGCVLVSHSPPKARSMSIRMVGGWATLPSVTLSFGWRRCWSSAATSTPALGNTFGLAARRSSTPGLQESSGKGERFLSTRWTANTP
jgi:hypothetical protein